MVAIKKANPEELIQKLALELKGKMKKPEFAEFIKTGVSKQRPPENPDWYFIRAASILRRIYIDGPIGVSRLRTYYGGLKNRGHKPSRFRKGSGKIIRIILQNLEELKLIEKLENHNQKNMKLYKGRKISPQGQKLLDKIAKGLK